VVDRVTVAIDVMSGDQGPAVAVPAAKTAIEQNEALSVILVGRRGDIEAFGVSEHPRIRIVEATEVVTMDERPSHALRYKQLSSMGVALRLVRDGEADACVSAGNTGALMMLGRSIVRMHPGIERPAIIKLIPSLHGRCYVLDLGANVDATAEHLYQFAIMGSLTAELIEGKVEPRVALLNVGAEEIKGSEAVRLAGHMLVESATVNYIGYVEGNDLFRDIADVVVCDGFVGNIALKTGEGVAAMLMELLRSAFSRSLYGKIVGWLARPVLRRLLHQIDPGRHNGASLLGLKGVVIKSHGDADAMAFRAAVEQAVLEARMRLPVKINERLDTLV